VEVAVLLDGTAIKLRHPETDAGVELRRPRIPDHDLPEVVRHEREWIVEFKRVQRHLLRRPEPGNDEILVHRMHVHARLELKVLEGGSLRHDTAHRERLLLFRARLQRNALRQRSLSRKSKADASQLHHPFKNFRQHGSFI
jgi:hypothetical protein